MHIKHASWKGCPQSIFLRLKNLAGQRRIAAKVDELLTTARNTTASLLAAMIAELHVA